MLFEYIWCLVIQKYCRSYLGTICKTHPKSGHPKVLPIVPRHYMQNTPKTCYPKVLPATDGKRVFNCQVFIRWRLKGLSNYYWKLRSNFWLYDVRCLKFTKKKYFLYLTFFHVYNGCCVIPLIFFLSVFH